MTQCTSTRFLYNNSPKIRRGLHSPIITTSAKEDRCDMNHTHAQVERPSLPCNVARVPRLRGLQRIANERDGGG